MTTLAPATEDGGLVWVPLADAEKELRRQVLLAKDNSEEPVVQARMTNLVVFCSKEMQAEKLAASIPMILAAHPARVILLIAEEGTCPRELQAGVCVHVNSQGRRRITSERVVIQTGDQCSFRLPFAVRSLLIGDLPTNLWWLSPQPPPLAGPLLFELAEYAQQLIFDSQGWLDPHRGVAGTAAWLNKFEIQPGQGRWRTAADLNWRRLKYWRRFVTQALDPATSPGAAAAISEVRIDHGPHAVTQAWELLAWLAHLYGWTVQSARIQHGVEMAWQVKAGPRNIVLRIKRLPDGPSEIRHIYVATEAQGRKGGLDFMVEDERRLAVMPTGTECCRRTMTFQRLSDAELVSRQLSDREPDHAFRASMEVARMFAQSVLTS